MKTNNFTYEKKGLQLDQYHLLLDETIFHNANGYIGVRSVFEEGYPDHIRSVHGQYINGFYDFSEVKQAEKLFGLVEERQTMLNVTRTQYIKLSFDNEEFSMFDGQVVSSKRWLDMKKGITGRHVLWRSPMGKEVDITIKRMTSFYQLPLFTIEYEITPLNFSGEVMFESHHDGNVLNFGDPSDPRTAEQFTQYITPISCEIKQGVSYITSKTSRSGLQVCSSVKNVVLGEHERLFFITDNNAICNLIADAKQGQKIRMIKYTVVSDSIRHNDIRANACDEMKKALSMPIESLYAKQEEYLDKYWENCSLRIDCDHQMNSAIKYNLFQLIQSVGKDDHSSIAPKGLSGEGYEGQFFWDSEMYIQPFFTITNPAITKKLIAHRYTTLKMAKENARRMGHTKGALYPWRTIMGKECSGYFPGGSAQYHINGDIAYSIIAYYLATKDLDFIVQKGAEIIFETARLWLNVGNFFKDGFHINAVTGPDEYTCIVNNNYYTNAIAKYHLEWAVKFYHMLKEQGKIASLTSKIKLARKEIEDFGRAAQSMYLPYDEALDINPQDDSFLQKKTWDVTSIPKENFPLLLHYHPLHLYRNQVCKQPDTVLSHFILEDTQSEQTMRNSYDYYEKITTHDSSLSTCIFSIMASRFGMQDKAMQFFGSAAHLDLLDINKNTSDGIHVANMGGTYMAIVYGFGGFRLKESGIYFSPELPPGWHGYEFKVHYEDSRIVISVTPGLCTFTLESGSPKEIFAYGEKYLLQDTVAIERDNADETLSSCDI